MKRKATFLRTITLTLMMGVSMGAVAGMFGFGSTSWKEEVLLHDGRKIVVDRWVKRGGRHEIGQKPSYQEQEIQFSHPENNEKIRWTDSKSDDIGTASFLPMLLDIVAGKAYVVANPMGCLSYNKWGRPNPPYVVFRYDNGKWAQIPFVELPQEIVTPNLLFSDPDTVIEKLGRGFVTFDEIKAIVAKYPKPEYRSILREPLPQERVDRECAPRVFYKGGWISPGEDSIGRRLMDTIGK